MCSPVPRGRLVTRRPCPSRWRRERGRSSAGGANGGGRSVPSPRTGFRAPAGREGDGHWERAPVKQHGPTGCPRVRREISCSASEVLSG